MAINKKTYELKDGGMGSRKFWLTIISMVFSLVGGPVIMWFAPAAAAVISSVYPIYIGAILTMNGVYQGANLANKWIVLKNGKVEFTNDPDKPTDPTKPQV